MAVVLMCGAVVPSPLRAEDNCGSMVETVTRFRGLVMTVEPLGRRAVALTPVDVEPSFAASVQIVSVEGGDGRLRSGETWSFGIHSPSRTFLTGAPAGVELDLELHALACDGTFRRFFDLREHKEPSIEPFEGRLEVGKTYTTGVRWDRDLGLLPKDRLTGPRHHGLGIDWKNRADFQELLPGGSVRRITFEVVERRTDHRGDRRWVTIYGCRILEVRGNQ